MIANNFKPFIFPPGVLMLSIIHQSATRPTMGDLAIELSAPDQNFIVALERLPVHTKTIIK